MATIKFLLQSDKSPANIYLRFTHGRETNVKRKTGLFIDPKKWSVKTGYPIPRGTDLNLKRDLEKLEDHVKDQHNLDYKRGVKIDGDWLDRTIKSLYNQLEPESLEFFVTYGEKYIEGLRYRTRKSGSAGATASSIGKYRTIVDKVRQFEEYHDTRVLLKDIDANFREAFIAFLRDVKRLADNTIGRDLKFIKTIANAAEEEGLEVSRQLRSFKGFTVDQEAIAITEEDITKLWDVVLTDERLDRARDWFIISCRTAQRASDLFRINKRMMTISDGEDVIQLVQKKTKEPVNIPIHDDVWKVLEKRNGDFPPVFTENEHSNNAMYNRYLKSVCEAAKIDEPTKGWLRNKETDRYEEGVYPKWKLISSHTGRRTFATIEYNARVLNPQEIMSITGHTSEKTFLKYVGKGAIDHAVSASKKWKASRQKKV